MHINIVTLTSEWILPKIAQRTADYYPRSDVNFTVGYVPVPDADVNYYVDLGNCYFAIKTNCDVAYFTHIAQNDIGWLRAAMAWQKFFQLDGIITMNKRYTDILESEGYPSNKLATIVPGETKNTFPLRKIVIGIVSRGGQPDYGPTFVDNFFRSYDCTNFKFRFLGDNWDSVYPIIKEKNIEADFTSDADYSIYPDFYKTIDYLLVQGIATAGPMSMQEALSTGIPVIAANVGFVNYEFTADYVFEPGNVEQLSAILDGIQAPILKRRAQVEHMSWEKYSTDVVDFILKIKGEKK